MLSSYSSPLALGHRDLDRLFNGTVYVQEKVDGSQFSFGVRDGKLFMRSRKQDISSNVPNMFQNAANTVINLFEEGLLEEGWTYRGEVLDKPKHNTLTYAMVPPGHIILYDIDMGDQHYISPSMLAGVASALGMYAVPCFDVLESTKPTKEDLERWLDQESYLGGCKIEGVVFKNYDQYGHDHKVLMGKYVSPEFKEKHSGDWKDRNPNRSDLIQNIIEQYRTEARWKKAVQHLGEQDLLTGTPKDIGPLMKEISSDFETECAEEIAGILWKHFRKDIVRSICGGFPEWYLEYLQGEDFGN